MATLRLYTKGASVWIPDPDAVWVSAQLLQDYNPENKNVLLQLPGEKEAQYPVAAASDLPPLANPDISEGENDLTALSFLHEPAILHNLRVRFLDYNSIYTYCGIVLVAVNPYDELPIYGEEVIDAYSGQDMAEMEPHIFSVAEDSYRTMIREENNQSIIISGESGSGKTVSAKFTMRYFAVVGGAAQQTSVEDKVLASNPIMEAIGNAKTTRNDNSSRFGKYIQIGFGRKGDIIGANMSTYLLEKSRVVFQAAAERNYHIFYQLCASRQLPEMRSLKLAGPEHFRYTNQGGDTNIPGTDDVMEMERTRNAFTILGVFPDQQMELYRILAAILHLGNVKIQGSGRTSDRSYIDSDDSSLAIFSKLLGVEAAHMAHWLCHRRLVLAGDALVKPMTGQQAVEARDALAKHVYEQMFKWTVHRLNSALRSQASRARTFIGVLDIYGFETFERNSFEQFCINYANEKLQQQFNRHVFHLEQEEYLREELTWRRIEFSDNQQCIHLIEGQLGLLDLLDEECRMPKGSDDSWVQKLYDQHLTGRGHPHFRKPRMSNSAFVILHFADTVQYECGSFLDKNRDTVFEELVNVLKASQSELVAELFQSHGKGPNVANGSIHSERRAHREHKLTVGFQFRQSLQMLMDTLNSTTPHYVRCIKPNDLKEPFMFDPKRTVQQLRACGVLETIRISAAGFPSRWTYEEFFFRYRVLLRGSQRWEEARLACVQTLPQLIPDPDQYAFGKTKVFFRAGQVALLERLRAEKLRGAAVILQSWVRGWLVRIHYTRTLKATVIIQRYWRGALARRLAQTLRYTRAALVIQKTYRMLVDRHMFLLVRQAAITIQAFVKGMLTRRQYRLLLAERAATLLQARVRGWLARRAFTRFRAAVVFAQCCIRRKAARKELLKLKTEARSVARYKELNKGMEVKLMQLQIRADQEARERAALKETLRGEREFSAAELASLRAKIEKLEAGQKKVSPSPACSVVSMEVEQERRRTEEKAAQELQQLTQAVETLQREKVSLTRETEHLTACLLQQKQKQEAIVQKAVAEATVALRAEVDEERRKHQGLLREFTRLEQRCDNLSEMSQLSEGTRGLLRSDSMLSSEPLSPSPQSLTPLSLSPFPSTFPSPEEVRRVSVTSPSVEGRFFEWNLETPMEHLMDKMGLTKEPAVKLEGEDLAHAYDAVRVANKFLESQLLSLRSQWEEEVERLRSQLVRVSSGSSFHQQDLLDASEQECARLRKEVKELRNSVTLRRLFTQVFPSAFLPDPQPKAPALAGLFQCRRRDESKLIRNLISDVRTDVGVSLAPGLAANVVFLCVRQADSRGDQSAALSLCRSAVSAMKTALKKHNSDLEMTALWLKNISLLHDLLTRHKSKQTSVPEEFPPLTFDPSQLIHTLSELRIQAYQQLVSITEKRLQNSIATALLEGEDIATGSRRRATSAAEPDAPTMAGVLRELGALHAAISHQALHVALMEHAFHQLAYFMSATALNSLLFRKDVCCCSRGIHIRLNVSQLEEWLRSRGLQTEGAVTSLSPLIQAAQLLQVGKNSKLDAEAIVRTCTALSSQQIVKLLSNYTPHGDVEERVSVNFIRSVQALLKDRAEAQPRQVLLEVKRVFPVIFPDETPPAVRADELVIPDALKISFLHRV
ncbi:unconventional myosin-Vb [Syngnathoides biaculeatus]|uniref:unconventional myosin-Vb n=1 Tax=Syngnathoides biaculeatus TaxID=300417 RepID=UPI002ADDBCEF|nr:unconventional myosin-Vb [Syngnathoides biaculeatus]